MAVNETMGDCEGLNTKRDYDVYITALRDIKATIIRDIDAQIERYEGHKKFTDE